MADVIGNLGNTLGSQLGLVGGANFSPFSPVINEGVDPTQVLGGFMTSQDALKKQQDFVNALQGNMGLQNQAALSTALQGQMNGTGPNPAQQALANATGANVANQNALMAGQRGANANVGLMARQAAMQGSGIQQQAAGQSALLQAQQQIAAQQALQQLAASQVGQQQQGLGLYNQAGQSEQQLLLNALAEANKAKVSLANNQNSVMGNLAQGQQSAAFNTLGNLGAIAGKALPSLFSGGSGSGGGGGASASDVSNANGQDQSDVQLTAHGGMIKGYDTGGIVDDSTSNSSGLGPRSFVGRFLAGQAGANVDTAAAQNAAPVGSPNPIDTGDNIYGPKRPGKGEMAVAALFNGPFPGGGYGLQGYENKLGVGKPGTDPISGGPSPANINLHTSGPDDPSNNPGQIIIGPTTVGGGTGGFNGGFGGGFNSGGVIKGEKYAKQMKPVPGKPSVKGDSLKNDKVKAMLSPGEIILPRSVTTHPNAPEKAREFVAAIMAKNGMRK